MKNAEFYSKILGLALCLFFILTGINSPMTEFIIFGGILLSIGIPHGAIDHLTSDPKLSKKSFSKFLSIYLSLIVVYSGIWYLFPLFALVIFLLFSAYHFGQTHYLQQTDTAPWKEFLLYLSKGSFFLSVILFGSFEETQFILSSIVSIGFLENFQFHIILFFLLAILFSQFLGHVSFKKSDILELTLLPILLYYSPLFISFAVYFGFWHSLPSMISEYTYLSKFPAYSSIKKFIAQLLPFSLISVVGIVLILFFGLRSLEVAELTLLFFIMISVISFPHIIYMDRFFRKISKTDPYSA